EQTGAVEDVEEPLLVLEDARVGLESAGRQQRCEQPVAAALTDVQRLGHGAEVGLEAAREGGRDGKRHGGAPRIETEQVGRCRSSADRAERGRRVPALVVVMIVDGARQPDLGLHADEIGRQQLLAARSALLAQREQRGDQRHRLVAAENAAEIVVVEGVGGGAVDEGGIQRAGAAVGAEDQRLSGGVANAGRLQEQLGARLRQAGQRHSDRVDDRCPCGGEGRAGDALVVEAADPLGQASGERCGGRLRGLVLGHRLSSIETCNASAGATRPPQGKGARRPRAGHLPATIAASGVTSQLLTICPQCPQMDRAPFPRCVDRGLPDEPITRRPASLPASAEPGGNSLTRMTAPEAGPLSRRLAEFAAALRLADVPAHVRERAKLHVLDAIGVGLASNAYAYARRAVSGVEAMGTSGSCTVLGRRERFAVRDAALLNGILIHGLDFDDTHLASIVHPTATSLPCALSLAESIDASGEEMLAAYLAGAETAIRIGGAVK